MPCYRPLKAWRSLDDTPNGKKAIVFQKSANSTHSLTLPCGQCIGCKLDRSLMWAIRCVHESQLHSQNSFITLTYAPEQLPSDGSLVKYHFQDFMKRLRFSFKHQKIKYYMCGEYGEKFTRPHYHACLFGIDFPDKEILQEKEGILLYSSTTLDKLWSHGHTSIGDVTFETAAYCARYIQKKITGQNAEQHYYRTCEHTMNLIPVQPEYSHMSNGIGKEFMYKYQSDLYPSDFAIYKNRKIKLPRYYDELYDKKSENLEAIKLARKQRARKQLKENTPERLAVREKFKTLQLKRLTRSYEL